MSRTIRRKQKWLERSFVGTFQEMFEDCSFYCGYETYDAWKARIQNISQEKYYEQKMARFHRDHGRGHYGVPRWYRMQTGAHQNRVQERQKLIRCQQYDSWDNHLPDPRTRGMSWYW